MHAIQISCSASQPASACCYHITCVCARACVSVCAAAYVRMWNRSARQFALRATTNNRTHKKNSHARGNGTHHQHHHYICPCGLLAVACVCVCVCAVHFAGLCVCTYALLCKMFTHIIVSMCPVRRRVCSCSRQPTHRLVTRVEEFSKGSVHVCNFVACVCLCV